MPTVRPVRGGAYCPVVTFFDKNEDLDIPAFVKHVVWVADGGMDIVIAGTNGEAAHLTHPERAQLVKAAREALDAAGHTDTVIITGASTASTRETIQFAKEAAEAGADAVIALLSTPFASGLISNRAAIKQHFVDVAAGSPIPVMIYNYPVAAAGIDLDSTLILELAQASPNICGAKLTCANMGKLARISSITSQPAFKKQYPRSSGADVPFWVGSGYSDFLYPSILGRATGCITGLGNVAPTVIAELFKQSVAAVSASSKDLTASTQELQDIVAAADGALAATGIGGTKYMLSKLRGYGGIPRRPLPAFNPAGGPALEEQLAPILALEKQLSANKAPAQNGHAVNGA
ncbi:aldolase [Calocera viscosa TUFC12733]|uniref:Aldolase n=1 Tax=Calocera viscosa (strain TUFC12733) TaxID=1330018 RepID=A0A167RKQ8_CALVF|nr:aldolase [Calocera viscosa TUFC12733]